MQIQVNSDNNITADSELSERVRADVGASLGRFEDELTRVEVFLSDVNGSKSGLQDKRCVIEARPAGHEPLDVSDEAGSVEEALEGALDKMERVLNDHFEKTRDQQRHRD